MISTTSSQALFPLDTFNESSYATGEDETTLTSHGFLNFWASNSNWEVIARRNDSCECGTEEILDHMRYRIWSKESFEFVASLACQT